MVAAWSVCILTLTPLDFDANLEQMEMAIATFLGLPGVLIFWELFAGSCDPLLFRPPIALAFPVATAMNRASETGSLGHAANPQDE